jgi:hypothetical protein
MSVKRCVDEGLGFALLPTWCIDESDRRLSCIALPNAPRIPIYFGEAMFLKSNPFVRSLHKLCLEIFPSTIEERAGRWNSLDASRPRRARAAARS